MADAEGLDAREVDTLLSHLERMTGGETALRIPLRGERGACDALSYGVNALVGELALARELLARESEAKSDFLRNLSHECRTPLTAILSVAELLARDAISEGDRRDYGERIARNVRGLLGLLDDILDLSRLDAGALVLEKTRVELGPIVGDVVSSLSALAERKGVGVRWEALPCEPLVLHTNARRLRQILVNLVGNAIKFTERGEVLVSFGRSNEDGPAIRVDVSDTGIGVTPAAQEQLFELFQQGGSDITERFGGSGIGLAVSRRFAEALGGSLRLLHSELGRGSVFRLSLPHDEAGCAAKCEGGAPPARPLAHCDPHTCISGLHVLVAEDNVDIRELVRAVLESEGARVSLVADGLAAKAQALSLAPDVVLMDLHMPLLDGHSAASQLRAGGYTKPILCLTARASAPAEIELGAGLFDDVLLKPLEIETLLETLARHARAR